MKCYVYMTLFLCSGSAIAHHGPGQFDASQTVEVTGVVTDVRLVNPHGYVYFDVTGADGEAIPWRCELQAGSLLRRTGWTDDLFPVGGTITVTGDQGRREAHACALRTVVLADGRVIQRNENFLEDAAKSDRPLRRADGQINLAGAWAAPLRSVAGGPGDAGMGMATGMRSFPPPSVQSTAAGLAALEGLSHDVDNPRFHCMAVNIFFDWEFDRHVNEIVQTENTMTLKYGFMDIVRTIHLDMDEHPADITPTRAGHSIGHWKDDVLVVDTVGFEEGFIIAGPGGIVKHSDKLHAVERFTYEPETRALSRSYAAEDPEYFVGQYTGEDTVFESGTPFDPYDCVELKDEGLQN